MREVSFTVIGLPAPQGSKGKFGQEDNKRTKPWREAVAAEAAAAMNGAGMWSCPVSAHVEFHFPRPKSHYRTGAHADELRADAPAYVDKKPDLDKLLRSIGDALTGVLLRDDALIASWEAAKYYGEPVRAFIILRELDDDA
jgi:crossover junction endodeoxyribonuclease RusA